ncbi:hypothetical protein [Frankia sp. AgB32]|uniref:hypothetical protein n=1 Tax=Frankia sp. AgB32 TaxID=631119 RepID=UPI002010A2CE|nr:hypothetical protein [Frankia sp. AgB32]MCK9898131.1 hypothetical protein [Frankia sp. AgB32]
MTGCCEDLASGSCTCCRPVDPDPAAVLRRLDPEELNRALAAVAETLRPIVEAVAAALIELGRQAEAIVAALRDTGRPSPYRDDRPRWQSPYGPPRERR